MPAEGVERADVAGRRAVADPPVAGARLRAGRPSGRRPAGGRALHRSGTPGSPPRPARRRRTRPRRSRARAGSSRCRSIGRGGRRRRSAARGRGGRATGSRRDEPDEVVERDRLVARVVEQRHLAREGRRRDVPVDEHRDRVAPRSAIGPSRAVRSREPDLGRGHRARGPASTRPAIHRILPARCTGRRAPAGGRPRPRGRRTRAESTPGAPAPARSRAGGPRARGRRARARRAPARSASAASEGAAATSASEPAVSGRHSIPSAR